MELDQIIKATKTKKVDEEHGYENDVYKILNEKY